MAKLKNILSFHIGEDVDPDETLDCSDLLNVLLALYGATTQEGRYVLTTDHSVGRDDTLTLWRMGDG